LDRASAHSKPLATDGPSASGISALAQQSTNGSDEARTILGEIYNWFTEGFDLPDLPD
jgi:hypothetical protein